MKNISTLVFDLETLPDGPYPTPEEIKAPANYSKPTSILEYQNNPKNLEAEYRKRALSPVEGRILSIAWVLDDEPVRSVINADERIVLDEFQTQLQEQFRARFGGDDVMAHPTWIAHNGRTFDISFLFLRILKYDLEWLQRVMGTDIKEIRQEDTMMVMGVLNGYRTYVSLAKACAFFGIESPKGGMSGKDVYDYFKAGRLDEIQKYDEKDTIACYELAKKLKLIL